MFVVIALLILVKEDSKNLSKLSAVDPTAFSVHPSSLASKKRLHIPLIFGAATES